MDSFEVRQVINELSTEVRNFHKNRNGKSWSWSCLVCGDSRVNTRKARFGVAIKDGSFVCHCFNCGYSASFGYYLKDYHPHLYERVVVKDFINSKNDMFDLNPLVDKLNDRVLINIFYLNKFKDFGLWVQYAQNKKIDVTKSSLKKLYHLHKDYWNAHSMV